MRRSISRCVLFVAVALCSSLLAFAEDVQPSANRIQPPKITLRGVATGGESGMLLAIEVSNPNDAALVYTGYSANSFAPPLTSGRISPICQIELKRDGQWRRHPIGYCGFGLTDQELPPGASAAFDVSIPGDNWQVVKVAFGGICGFSLDGESTTTTLWNAEFARDAIDALDALFLDLRNALKDSCKVGGQHYVDSTNSYSVWRLSFNGDFRRSDIGKQVSTPQLFKDNAVAGLILAFTSKPLTDK